MDTRHPMPLLWALLAFALVAAAPEPTARDLVLELRRPPILTGDAKIVAACESGIRKADGTAVLGSHRWDTVDGHRRGGDPLSSASGAFRFVDPTWRWALEELRYPLDRWPRAKDAPPQIQRAAFGWLWDDRRGSSHYAASASCWRPMLPP